MLSILLLFAILTVETCNSFAPAIRFIEQQEASRHSIRTPAAFHQGTCIDTRTAAKTRLHLLSGLFGNDNKTGECDVELAVYNVSFKKTKGGSSSDVGALADYLVQWAQRFVGPDRKQLTTPVKVLPTSMGVQILFQKVNTGYADRDKGKEDKKESPATDKQGKQEVKQGGVEIVVLADDDGGSEKVVARRCEMDEDTMIKEMSEIVILKELHTAIDVWKKNHSD